MPLTDGEEVDKQEHTSPLTKCEGCGKNFLNLFGDDLAVCMKCITYRQRAVVRNHRCVCRTRKYEDPTVHQVGSRRWMTCRRCLGTTRQLS